MKRTRQNKTAPDSPGRKAEELLGLMRGHHRRLQRDTAISVTLTALTIFAAGSTLLLLFESALYLSPAVKSGLLLLLLAGTAIAAIRTRRRLRLPAFKDSLTDLSRRIDEPRLLDGLDLWLNRTTDPEPLRELAIRRNLEPIDTGRLGEKLNQSRRSSHSHRSLRTSGVLAAASLLLLLVPLTGQPDAVQRSLAFWQSFDPPNPWQFTISPESETVEHGAELHPRIHFEGDTPPPEELHLALRTGQSDTWRLRPMTRSGEATWTAPPVELTSDAVWHIRMDGHRSGDRTTQVRLQPRFDELTLEVRPPEYTGLEPDTHTYPVANIETPAGSRILLKGRTNRPLTRLQAVFDSIDSGSGAAREETSGRETDRSPLTLEQSDSLTWQAEFDLHEEKQLRFEMEDRFGLSNRTPYRIRLNPSADEAPTVVISRPEGDLTLPRAEPIAIHYRAGDDYGLNRAELSWRLERAFTTEAEQGSRRLETPQIGELNELIWDLQELDLRPRDQVTFRITVWDNDGIDGSKQGRSRPVEIEIPSVSAQMEEIREQESRTEDRLGDVEERSRRLEQSYERFRNRIRDNPQPGRQEQQMALELNDDQQALEEAVEELNRQFEEFSRQLERNDNISEETLRASRELQELFEELDDPELQQALQELREAMADLDPEALERALDSFEFNEELYRQRVERTLELFRSLQMNSELERLAGRFEELSSRMEELSERQADEEQKRQEQRQIREETEPLDRELEELGSRAPQRAAQRLEELRRESREDLAGILEMMERLEGAAGEDEADTPETDGTPGDRAQSEQETGGEPGDAEDSLRRDRLEVADRLGRRGEALRQARQQIQGQQIQVNLLAMQRSLYWLIELSEEQQSLLLLTRRTDDESSGFVELARRQNDIRNQFTQVADTLLKIAGQIPALSEQISRRRAETGRALTQTRGQMAERIQSGSLAAGHRSLAGLNELASMIADAVDQLMDRQGDGSGSLSMNQMGEQMEGLSAEQQEMNRQIDQLINDLQGERLTREESERLDQLARQQQQIREQIRQLQQSGALRSGDRRLSDLEQIARQMEESIGDLRGGSTNPLLSERQQNILSRMLRTQESLQEQGESDEMAGQQPERQSYERPDGTWDPEELERETRSRLMDPRFTPFRPQFQELIERYFERLREDF